MPERRILILFAHPALEKSRVNRELLAAARAVERVTINDLYEAYPDFDVDVAREQTLLAAHDVVVLHHPFYWYSTPALLKQWEDLVLQHGWAYGTGGTALRGKWLLSAVTTGGREAAYQEGGYNRFTIRQLLAPIEQTARLCGMEFLPPFVVHGTHRLTPDEVRVHGRDYAAILTALRDGQIDAATMPDLPRLNADPGRLPAQLTGGR